MATSFCGLKTPEEFLFYMQSMAQTPRCGVSYKQIALLLRLSEEREYLYHYEKHSDRWSDGLHSAIERSVKQAWSLRKEYGTFGLDL